MSLHPLRLSRRTVMCAPLAGLAAATVRAAATKAGSPAVPTDAWMCVLTPQSVEGPFYLDPKLVRSTIAEGRPGVALRLALRVVEAATCEPIPGARVDVSHADAQGRYSGYPGQGDGGDVDTTGQYFLRGTQLADAFGAVLFETIWPGWYPGRATHVHFKVFLDARNVAMGQIYFPDALNEYLYDHVAAYRGRKATRDVVNSNDVIARGDDPNHLGFCAVSEERNGYRASLTLGVDRQATAQSRPPSGFPPLAEGPRPGGSGRLSPFRGSGPGGAPPPPPIEPITDRAHALIPGQPG